MVQDTSFCYESNQLEPKENLNQEKMFYRRQIKDILFLTSILMKFLSTISNIRLEQKRKQISSRIICLQEKLVNSFTNHSNLLSIESQNNFLLQQLKFFSQEKTSFHFSKILSIYDNLKIEYALRFQQTNFQVQNEKFHSNLQLIQNFFDKFVIFLLNVAFVNIQRKKLRTAFTALNQAHNILHLCSL